MIALAMIVLVLASCATNSAPTAAFTTDVATGTTARTFAFDATTSGDPEGSTLVYAWSFGDGATASGVSVNHQYADPGSYRVELTVTDVAGATDTAEATLPVAHSFDGLQGALAEFGTAVGNLMMEVGNDPALLALAAYPGLDLPALFVDPANLLGFDVETLLRPDTFESLLAMMDDVETLPRGEFDWDPGSASWDLIDGTIGDLIARWPFEAATGTSEAELILDWNAVAETQHVADGLGGTVEVPVAMHAELSVDNEVAGALDLTFAWYDGPPCSRAILEPTDVTVVGEIGVVDTLSVDAALAITDQPTAVDTLTSSGTVAATSPSDAFVVEWDVEATASIARFDPDAGNNACFVEDLAIDDVAVDLQVDHGLSNETTSFDLAMQMNMIDAIAGTGFVQEGTLAIDGIPTLTIEGSLEDADMDGMVDVNLTDVDGNVQSLAEFLMSIPTDEALRMEVGR
jgi:PKD repeat protein